MTCKRRLLDLGKVAFEALRKGEITESHAQAILSKDKKQEEIAVNKIKTEKLSVKRTRELFLDDNVRRLTSSNVSENGLLIGVWISEENYDSLKKISSSRKTTIEELCSHIIDKEVNNYD